MKRITLFLSLIFCGFNLSISAQNLRAEFAMAEFLSPNEVAYIETYLKLKGNSLAQAKTEEGAYSEVFITYRVTNGVWVPFKDSYKVRGPVNKEGEFPLDFIDQRRIPLKPGSYDLEITIEDVLDYTKKKGTVKQQIVIEKNRTANLDSVMTDETIKGGEQRVGKYYKSRYTISGLQIVDTYSKTVEQNILSKAGFDLIPYTDNYYPSEKKDLTFYAEIYSTYKRSINPDDRFLIDMYVENADNGKIVDGLRKFVRAKDAEVTPVLHTFPIDRLPSGNYNLVVEARDDKNRVMDRGYFFFQRQNEIAQESEQLTTSGEENELYGTFVSKYQNLDQLKEFLLCLYPISSQEEIRQVNTRMNFRDRNMMWKFMYYFWKQRAPENPEAAWLAYWKEVEKVNATYSTNHKKGYETDRGRVYLQYGAPNTISPNYFEPNTYPYEIWHYYTLTDQNNADQANRKFVFANMEGATKEFDLIHSDAKNEITNVRWHHDLHSRSSQSINLDVEDAGDHTGGRARDFFDNPY